MRRPAIKLVLLLSTLFAATATAQSNAAAVVPTPSRQPQPQPVPAPPSAGARRGQVDFERYCATCHGSDGDGRGPSAHRFEAVATNFTRGVYKCRSTPSGALPSDADLRRSIVQGLYGSGMPPFASLNSLQVDDLIETLKHFSARFLREPQGVPVVDLPEPTADATSVARGAEVYDRMKCANCHGVRGEGSPAAAVLRNDDGSPALATDFTQRQSLRCGESAERLYVTLMTGVDGTPMSAYQEAISPDEAWALVHYVSSLRR